MVTSILTSSRPSATRCAPHPLATAPSFHHLLVSSVLEKVRIESIMKSDTSPRTQRGHQATVTHPMGMVPSILEIHLLRKSMAAVETLPPHFLGKIRTGQDSPSVLVPCPVLGILLGRKFRPGGEASMMCLPSRGTLTGSTLNLSPLMILHN